MKEQLETIYKNAQEDLAKAASFPLYPPVTYEAQVCCLP